MTDSLTPEDIQRIEDALEISSIRTMAELERKLNEKKKGEKIYPKGLRDFLKDRLGRDIISRETEDRIKLLSRKRDVKLDRGDRITFAIRYKDGKQLYYVRTAKGRIKTSGVDTVKPDFKKAISKKEQDIEILKKKLEKEMQNLEKLKDLKKKE